MENIEHPTPTCPNCDNEKTRPLDRKWAHCFTCDDAWMMSDHVQKEMEQYWDDITEVK